MARLNSTLRFILVNVNFFFVAIGLFLIAIAIYMFAGNFGDLDPGFFLGAGLLILFLGLSLVFGACLGCQGAQNQGEKFGPFWTGRKILFIYQVLITLLLIAEFYMCSTALQAAGDFAQVYPLLNDGEVVPYATGENALNQKFNKVFFAAASTCEVTVYSQFWSWVGTHCDGTLHRDTCEACYDYSVTFCSGDQNACYASVTGDIADGPACPYTQCRAAILEYVVLRIKPVSYAIFCLCIFQLITAFLNMMVLCYTPRDNLETILIKSGTLSHAKTNV